MIKGHNINKWPLMNPQGDIRNDKKGIKKISMMADLDRPTIPFGHESIL
jgi:hypothetical protein